MSGGEAPIGIGMQNARDWNPTVEQRGDPLPRHAGPLTATDENVSPKPAQPMHKQMKPISVTRDRVILVIAQRDLLKPWTE
jgi:hypothetical protein